MLGQKSWYANHLTYRPVYLVVLTRKAHVFDI